MCDKAPDTWPPIPEDEGSAYGCVFCITGKEQTVADRIERTCPDIQATTVRKMRYRTQNKVKTREETIALPSYVFFKAPVDTTPSACFPKQDILRVLTTEKWNWQLVGGDEKFARWIFRYDGLLDFSKAYREGDRIKIISGPLKDMEGQITRIDKRGCSGQVVLSFNGKSVPVWLGFEMIDHR